MGTVKTAWFGFLRTFARSRMIFLAGERKGTMTATNPPHSFGKAPTFADIEAELHRSRQQLEDTKAVISAVEDELAGRTFSGADRKSMVTVTLRRDGMVDEVTISPKWRTKIAPTALGSATLSAYRAARANLVDEVATAFAGAGLPAFSEQLRLREQASAGPDEDEESR
jgi:DNA-binding protein YbaB